MLAKPFELLPQARRIGLMSNPDLPLHAKGLREVETAALRSGVPVRPVPLRTPDEIAPMKQALQRERVDAVHVFSRTVCNTGDRVAPPAGFALQQRWPTTINDRPKVAAGMPMAYGWRIDDRLRRLPHCVTRILEGTPPGELPAEPPTRTSWC